MILRSEIYFILIPLLLKYIIKKNNARLIDFEKIINR